MSSAEEFRYAADVNEAKRQQNEGKFGSWIQTQAGGRLYWCEVEGRLGWKARYLKEVDSEETTLSFWQEIYNNEGVMVEVHHKFPEDLGHTAPGQGEAE